jgi:DNA ligase (NAD+)
MPNPRLDALRNLILKAKHAYYYSGEPIMSDAEYDALEDQLRLLAPEDPVLALVGAPVSGAAMMTKAHHAIPMGSQSKVNTEAEFRQWHLKAGGGALHASLKGDGASAAAYYREGRLVQAISRGDGTLGEDITANALRFQGLPAWAGTDQGGFTGAVRFEVILTLENWSRVDPQRRKNPRNAGNGIMGRKHGHQSDLLTSYAFDLDETRAGQPVHFATEGDKAQRLAALGFNLIPQQRCAEGDAAVAYFQQVARSRDQVPFWIDGIVLKVDDLATQQALGVTAGRPKGQIAWKFDSAGAETVLEQVLVSGGHTGALIPVARLRPVTLGGTTVGSATLGNFDEITRLDLALGDKVWVIKANDIIPKIIRVTDRPPERQPIPVPSACPFCGGAVGRKVTTGGEEGAILACRDRACPQKSIGKIARWIKSLDILGIGDAVLNALVEHFAIEDAGDLYTLRDQAEAMAALIINPEKDLRLGAKRTASILAAIDGTRTLTLSQFLGSLGGEGLGKRRVELMIKAAGGDLDRLDDWRGGRLRDPALAERAGVPNLGGPIQDALDALAPVIDKLLAHGVEILPPAEDLHAAPEGDARRTLCISGRLPSGQKKADYQAALAAQGIDLVDSVTQGLDWLVLADPDSASAKAVKARKLGVRVIGEEALMLLAAGGVLPD